MYDTAPDREQVAHIHLFGIQYTDELHGLTNQAIVDQAGTPRSYDTTVASDRAERRRQLPTQDAMDRAWQVLTRRASEGRTITYGELRDAAGLPEHPIGIPSQYLDPVWLYCEEMGKPNMASIVVSGRTGKPGSGYPGDHSRVPSMQRRVFAYDWSGINPPTVTT